MYSTAECILLLQDRKPLQEPLVQSLLERLVQRAMKHGTQHFHSFLFIFHRFLFIFHGFLFNFHRVDSKKYGSCNCKSVLFRATGHTAPKKSAFRHTSVCFEKKPMEMKRDPTRDPCIWKETYKWGLDATKTSAFRHTCIFWKEPYENEKRPTKRALQIIYPFARNTGMWVGMYECNGGMYECNGGVRVVITYDAYM